MATKTAKAWTLPGLAVVHLVALRYFGVLRVQRTDHSIGAWCHLQPHQTP